MAIFHCCLCLRLGEDEDLGVIIDGRIYDAIVKKKGDVRLTLCAECWEKMVMNVRRLEELRRGIRREGVLGDDS